MSLPTIEIHCTQCDFTTSISGGRWIFKYLLPTQQTIFVSWTNGWCLSCDDIRPIENLLDLSKLNEEINKINFDLKNLSGSSIRKLFPSVKKQIHDFESDLQFLELSAYFLSIRKGPPVCLECGCKDVFPLKLSSHEIIVHPGCGGRLITSESDIRYFFKPKVRIYDVEGNRIDCP